MSAPDPSEARGCKLRRSSLSPTGRPGGRPYPEGPRAGGRSRTEGWGRQGLVPRAPPRRYPVPSAGSTHVSLHKRPHEAAVHGSSGRARPHSTPRRAAQRSHGPSPECGRAPPSRSRSGRAGRCGGRPQPLSAHARPGPRRPAWGWPLGGAGRAPGLLAVRQRAGSSAVQEDPTAALLLCSALLPFPPASSDSQPSQSCLRPPDPSAHVTSSCEHAPRGPLPPPRLIRSRTLLHAPAGGPPPFLRWSQPPGPGSEPRGGGRLVGRLPCCLCLGADSVLPPWGPG